MNVSHVRDRIGYPPSRKSKSSPTTIEFDEFGFPKKEAEQQLKSGRARIIASFSDETKIIKVFSKEFGCEVFMKVWPDGSMTPLRDGD